MDKKTFKQIFTENWLFEMPMDTGPSTNDPYPILFFSIDQNIENGVNPFTKHDLHFLYIAADVIYCWYGDFDIIAELSTFEKGLAIELVGKKPGSAIHASDFYQKIVKATNGSLLFSGNSMSNEAFKTWSYLLKDGGSLMVYDPANTKDFVKISTIDDLKQFYAKHIDYQKYRYVLSENINEVFSDFTLMRTYLLSLNNS